MRVFSNCRKAFLANLESIATCDRRTGHTRFRADRLLELFSAHEGMFTLEDARDFQADKTSVAARQFAEAVCALVPEGSEGADSLVMQLLRGWDGHMGETDSAPLAYHELSFAMIERTVRPFFGPKAGNFWAEEMRLLLDQLLQRSELMLGQYADWAAVVRDALPEALATLEEKHGPDPAAWEWGAVHRVAWRHSLGRDDAELFNLTQAPAHLPLGGDGNTTCCLSGDYEAAGVAGVSYRQLFDLADLNGAQIVIPPGNSGRLGSPHAGDNIGRWKAVEYHPLYVAAADVEAHKAAQTELVPQTYPGAKL